MSPSVTWIPESEEWPFGRAWKLYWKERQADQTKKALRYISKEKQEARRRMHRKLRRNSRKELKSLKAHDRRSQRRNQIGRRWEAR